jgi:hypothetical protein
MVVVMTPSEGKPSMGKAAENLTQVTRIGLDLAKTVFQVHGVGAEGEVVTARKLRRGTMLGFSAGSRPVSRRWRLAVRRIIGAASSWRWVTR